MGSGTANYSRGGERTWQVFLAALLLAAAVHVFPLLFFKPMEKQDAAVETGRRFTVMVGREPTAQDDPFDLYYWLQYGNPTDFSAPDYDHGFSAGLRVRQVKTVELRPIPPESVSLTRKYAYPVNHYFPAPRTPEELLFPLYPHTLTQTLSASKNTIRQSGRPLWTMADGTELGDLFADSPDILRHIARTAPQRGTVLRLTPSDLPELPPRIQVIQSCGNTELDIQAAGALAAHAGAGLSREQLERLKYVIVDWQTAIRTKKKEKTK